MLNLSLAAFRSKPRTKSARSFINDSSLAKCGGDEGLWNLAPIVNLLRGIHHYRDGQVYVRQGKVERNFAPMWWLVRILNHEEIIIAVFTRVPSRSTSEENNLLGPGGLDDPPNNRMKQLFSVCHRETVTGQQDTSASAACATGMRKSYESAGPIVPSRMG